MVGHGPICAALACVACVFESWLIGESYPGSPKPRGKTKKNMDTIGDLLTRIRNASLARRRQLEAPWSRTGEAICHLLAKAGYLSKVLVTPAKTRRGHPIKRLQLTLAYTRKDLPVVTGLKQVSKPGRRRYLGTANLPRVLQGYGLAIISTSQGMMTDQEARKKKLGGEVICYVW